MTCLEEKQICANCGEDEIKHLIPCGDCSSFTCAGCCCICDSCRNKDTKTCAYCCDDYQL